MPYLLNNLRADVAYVEKLVIRKNSVGNQRKIKAKDPKIGRKATITKMTLTINQRKILLVIIAINKGIYQGITLRKIKRRMA